MQRPQLIHVVHDDIAVAILTWWWMKATASVRFELPSEALLSVTTCTDA